MGIIHKKGFTVVELVVVITIIGILTAVVTVGYRNLTTQSYNQQVIAGVKSYYEAIKAYKLVHKTYPKTQTEVDGTHIAMTCLGTGYTNSTCGKVSGQTIYEDALFNSSMNAFLKQATNPISNGSSLPVGNETYTGAVYGLDVTFYNGIEYGRVIEYALIGNTSSVDCGIPDAREYASGDNAIACEILLEAVDE